MWQRIKQSFRNFMMGRHGTDVLSMDLIKYGFILFILSLILAFIQNTVFSVISLIFNYLALAMYVISIFRTFSRNNEKRESENQRYIAWREKVRTKNRQAITRFKNRKNYKYFRCPGCKTWIRLPRGSGVVTVTCRKCQNSFTQKS